jgi:hypothetical protein
MRPRKPPPMDNGHWVMLVAPGAEPLPAERCTFVDPADNSQRTNGYETTWDTDPGEQKALINGAPIILRVWGDAHPPVSVHVGEPGPNPRALVDRRLWLLALGKLFDMFAGTDPDFPGGQPVIGIEREVGDQIRVLTGHKGDTFAPRALNLDEDAPDHLTKQGWASLFEALIGQAVYEEAHRDTTPTEGPQG